MTTETAGAPPAAIRGASYGFDWYVHKHRHEQEANNWDERRLRAADVSQPARPAHSPLISGGLLIKFISCAIGLTAALGIIVTAIR